VSGDLIDRTRNEPRESDTRPASTGIVRRGQEAMGACKGGRRRIRRRRRVIEGAPPLGGPILEVVLRNDLRSLRSDRSRDQQRNKARRQTPDAMKHDPPSHGASLRQPVQPAVMNPNNKVVALPKYASPWNYQGGGAQIVVP
jgi:hypothetical protein